MPISYQSSNKIHVHFIAKKERKKIRITVFNKTNETNDKIKFIVAKGNLFFLGLFILVCCPTFCFQFFSLPCSLFFTNELFLSLQSNGLLVCNLNFTAATDAPSMLMELPIYRFVSIFNKKNNIEKKVKNHV